MITTSSPKPLKASEGLHESQGDGGQQAEQGDEIVADAVQDEEDHHGREKAENEGLIESQRRLSVHGRGENALRRTGTAALAP